MKNKSRKSHDRISNQLNIEKMKLKKKYLEKTIKKNSNQLWLTC
jgi:hypothetical protein